MYTAKSAVALLARPTENKYLAKPLCYWPEPYLAIDSDLELVGPVRNPFSTKRKEW